MSSGTKAAAKVLCLCQNLKQSQELILKAPWADCTQIGWVVLAERSNELVLCSRILILVTDNLVSWWTLVSKRKKRYKIRFPIYNFAKLQYSSNEMSLTDYQFTGHWWSASVWSRIDVRTTGILRGLRDASRNVEKQGKLKNRLYLKGRYGKNPSFLQSIWSLSFISTFSCSSIYKSTCLKLLFKMVSSFHIFQNFKTPKYLITHMCSWN